MVITVAVVDDDPGMLTAVERLLDVHGYGTAVFKSAEDFLSRGDQSKLACVVLDVNLTGMSGIELMRVMRASGSTLPIVFLTGDPDEDKRVITLREGGLAFLRKPFTGNMLIETIKKAAA
jgi:FixJ family two-component response regulator